MNLTFLISFLDLFWLSYYFIVEEKYAEFGADLLTLRYRLPQNFKLSPKVSLQRLPLTEDYVVGLTEAEGCFTCYFSGKNLKVECEFSLGLIAVDKPILDSLASFFNVGTVQKKNKTSVRYDVKTDKELAQVIIPFFEQCPLLGEKRKSFFVMQQVLHIKTTTKLLQSPKTRKKTKMQIALLINTLLKAKRKYSLSEIAQKLDLTLGDIEYNWWYEIQFNVFLRGVVPFLVPSPGYVTGFCEGDGGCSVTIDEKRIIHTYNLGQSQYPLLEMFLNYFRVGAIYKVDLSKQTQEDGYDRDEHWRLVITSRKDLRSLYTYHFKQHPMFGSKQKAYIALIKVLDAVEQGEHLMPSKRQQLFDLVKKVNLEGKRRKKVSLILIKTKKTKKTKLKV